MTQAQNLFTAYADFHRLYVALLNKILVPYGLPAAQWAVLKRLYHLNHQDHPAHPANPNRPTLVQLAKVHGVEAPTMTASVKKLAGLGYVETETGADKRHRNILLTEKGRAVYVESQALVDRLTADLLAGATVADLEISTGLFQKLKSNLLQLS